VLRIFSLIVAAAYLAVWLRYLKSFLGESSRRDEGPVRWAMAAAALHSVYIVMLSGAMKHPPLTSVFEALTMIALMLSLIHIFMEQRMGRGETGAAIFFLVFGLQLVSSIFMAYVPGAPRVMNGVLLMLHVFLALVGYTAFAVAFLYSVMYLLLHRELRAGKFSLMFHKLPPLEELDEMTYRASLIGLLFLLVSVLLGFLWSRITFGFLPLHDTKVMMTVFTWLIYLAVLAFKALFGWQGRRMALLSVCGFALAIASLVLVNVIPYTFHSMY
jgi:ABC-type uncharacterized transport system permease subunit